jgi:predicted dehydrogenase
MSSQSIKLGIIGGGWPGRKHAEGAKQSGGYRVTAVADLIPDRRRAIMAEFNGAKEFDDAAALINSADVDAVTIAVPNHLHAEVACAALKAGKHVLIEKPPAGSAKDARKIAAAAVKAGKTVLYGFQRRFGPAEQAAKLAISKDYVGGIYHIRSTWLRTRGVPIGTGWFTKKSQSGGGAMIDVGIPMLDLAWFLLDQPKPVSAFAVTHRKLAGEGNLEEFDVEDAAFAMIKFDNGASLELGASWALNQPPQQQGTLCRAFGDAGCVDVYTPNGAVIYRQFDAKGASKPTQLKPPRLAGHAALMRHFRECILEKTTPAVGASEGVLLMEMIEAIYKSAASGKSCSVA